MNVQNCECIICHNDKAQLPVTAREFLNDTWEEFDYFECSNCGCVQIVRVPENLDKYYKNDYFRHNPLSKVRTNPLIERLKRYRGEYLLGTFNLPGILLLTLRPRPKFWDWLKMCSVDFDSRILDVGCAYGHILRQLKWEGFGNLLGIDPYIREDVTIEEKVRIRKKALLEYEPDEKFDLIMMHHVLEHLPLQKESMKKISELLAPGGQFLCVIPSASSYTWKHYRLDSFILDSPRHLFLHTHKSIKTLAESAGMKIEKRFYASPECEFMVTWASEQIKRGIAFMSDSSYGINPQKSIFSKKDIQRMKKEAEERFKKGEGCEPSYLISKA